MTWCPQCTDKGLRHAKLAERLAGYGCQECGGVLLSLVAYRIWRESNVSISENVPSVDDSVTVEDSGNAITCSKCSGLMTKYRIAASVANRLDYSPRCDDVWLDNGEWTMVEDLAMSGHLARVFTQPWQNCIQNEIVKIKEEEQLRELLGDDWDFFTNFRNWLNRSPARQRLIAYLQRTDR